VGEQTRARSLRSTARQTAAARSALAAGAREAATRAAELAGPGIALVFAALARPGREPECVLRAAAGFDSPAEARAAAAEIAASVGQALGQRAELSLPPGSLPGERAAGGGAIHPLALGERVHGALVVAGPAESAAASAPAIAGVAAELALRFDHARLEAELAELRASSVELSRGHEERGDEILRLSEALFTQDIELLRSHEKLGKIEKLKNDFIEKMSRELRTPLNRIIEAIIAVLTGEHDALSESSKAGLRAALDDGTAFLRTLQNILDLWRLKQGELPVEIQDLNFRETVAEAIFSVQDAVGQNSLAIETRIAEPFPKIRSDLAKISQILFLLLDNAVKFTPQGRIEISARIEDQVLHCQVRDTGIGICPDDRHYIFDEFFQIAEPSSRRYQGAGLGLTLARDLVTLLGGEISVSSEIGVGSAFAFSVPVQVVG
jgi:two-component system sensor histidine kinase ChiS